jgi:hypothetical protein
MKIMSFYKTIIEKGGMKGEWNYPVVHITLMKHSILVSTPKISTLDC